MTGPEELRRALTALRDAFQASIVPELSSPWAMGNADSINNLLNRLIAELTIGPRIAAEYRETVDRIESGLDKLLPATAPVRALETHTLQPDGPLAHIESAIARMQDRIYSGDNQRELVARLRENDPEFTRWFDIAGLTLIDMLKKNEASMASLKAPDERVVFLDPAELSTRLGAYLSKRFGLPADSITKLLIVPGGRAKLTALFEIVPNDIMPSRLVLRLDTAGNFTGTTVADEFPLLTELYKRGLAIPQPILVESDKTILGGTFIVTTEVLNSEPAGFPFPEERRLQPRSAMGPEFGVDLARFLAKLHSIKEFPGGAEISNTPAADPAQIIDDYYKLYRSKACTPLYSFLVDLGFAWLFSHPLPRDRPKGIVHGDFGSHNQMARDGRLAAVIDWELAHLGDPAEDIGYCRLMVLEDIIPWDRFVAEYVAAGGDPRACDPDAVNFWGVWSHLKNGVIQSVLRDNIVNEVPMGIEGIGGHWHFFFRVHQYLALELERALQGRRQ